MKNYSLILITLAGLFIGCSKKEDELKQVPPVAGFTVDTTKGADPLVVKFTNTSQNATTYVWNFGDNSTSALLSPTHTYASGGTYSVTLTASNSAGSNSITKTVIVQALSGPTTSFYLTNDSTKTWDLHSGDSGTWTFNINGTLVWKYLDGTTPVSENYTWTTSANQLLISDSSSTVTYTIVAISANSLTLNGPKGAFTITSP